MVCGLQLINTCALLYFNMEYLRHFYDNLWLWKCGLPELDEVTKREYKKVPTLESLKKSEWSPMFEQFMRNRLIFGAMRYGQMGHGKIPEDKPRYNRCDSIRKRLIRFEETGNAEWLVDVANLSLLMFEEEDHPDWHFTSVEEGYHDDVLPK